MSIKNLKDWWDIALRKEEYIKKTLLFEDDGAWSDGGVMNTSTLKSRNLKLTLDKIQKEIIILPGVAERIIWQGRGEIRGDL